jgi:hypothetical protein
MALAPLADVADLPAEWADNPRAERALEVASAAVRDAAESTISEVTGTVTVPAPRGETLSLGLVRNVTSVAIDGVTITDYKNVGGGLWRRCGWGVYSEVTITATFGLPEVPADIVDLTCQLAVGWLRHDAEGGGSTAGLTMAALDDAREGYSDEAAGQVSPTFVPQLTREWLRSRFSGGVAVVDAS